MSSHSRFAPSGSGRWAVCTASIPFIEANADKLPPQNMVYADRGTRAHTAGSQLILDPAAPVVVDDMEMAATTRAYAEFARSLIESGDTVIVEKKIRLFYLPSQKGTSDFALVSPKRIYILDYKDGVGVSVEAKENTQLAIYAESLIAELELIDLVPDDTLVVLAIYQPRDRSNPNPVRLWAITRKQLRDFVAPIAQAKADIEAGKVNFVAGPHCDKSFCPARGLCKHYGKQGLVALSNEPVDMILASDRVLTQLPSAVTREQRQRILAAKPLLIEWLEKIEDQEVAELLMGAKPQQFKLVEGKSNRQWSDEKAAEQVLLQVFPAATVRPPKPAELVSPAQAEKLVKAATVSVIFKEELSALITKPPGKPTLVPIEDKRPPLQIDPSEGLSKLSESDE